MFNYNFLQNAFPCHASNFVALAQGQQTLSQKVTHYLYYNECTLSV